MYHPIDDYVWLGGRPVVIVHGSLNSNMNRLSDSGDTRQRERDGSACGTYFPVTNYLGRPVLMLNDNLQIVGVGEYNPHGAMDRVTEDAETSPNVSVPTGGSVSYDTISQPGIAGLDLDFRVRLMAFDANCSGNGGLKGGVTMQTPGWGWWWSSCTLGNYWFPWMPQNSGGTVSVYANSGQSATYWGAIDDTYQYRRYQPGATPFWTPLRGPGQYHDEETDLDQNFNRFYSERFGRYFSPEPMWASPVACHGPAS